MANAFCTVGTRILGRRVGCYGRNQAPSRRHVGTSKVKLLEVGNSAIVDESLVVKALPSRKPGSVCLQYRRSCGSMLRRLRLPLPLNAATCRSWSSLDAFGDHRAACPRAGLFRGRGTPLERAAASIRREVGATVTVAANVFLRDFNIITWRHDERRIGVIANGLYP